MERLATGAGILSGGGQSAAATGGIAGVVALALMLAVGCGRSAADPEGVPTSGPKPRTTAPESAIDPAPLNAPDAVEPAAEEDASPPVAEDVAVAQPERNLPEPIRAFERAMHAVADCERLPDSIRVKDQASCLAPVVAARDAIRSPPALEGEPVSPEMVTALRELLADSLLRLLDDPNPTIVLYALMQNQPDFARDPATLARLQQLLESEDPDIAEWAMTVRFWQRNPADEGARLLALSVLESHRFDRVRLVACQYLGDPMFRGREGMFEILRARADDENDTELIRNCAVTRMGYLGGDEHIDAIASHLGSALRQAGAVQALQRGLASPKAHKAYLSWFEKHAAKADAIQWTAVANLAPPSPGAASYPVADGTRVLSKLVLSKPQSAQVRAAAVKSLERLGATAELRALASKLGAMKDPASAEVLAAVERAIAAAPPSP
ncbi:MAG: hypothetical protein R3F39_21100 [Myxococcota bacterium]